MENIGLIAAMAEECRPLLRRVQGVENCRIGGFPAYRFKLNERDCLLVQSGIGLKHAGDATRALLAEASPKMLVSFGIAGAVDDGLNIGDVVAIRSVILLDEGTAGLMVRLATLSGEAQQAITEALRSRSIRLVEGTALTTRGSQVVRTDFGEMENPVLEMETAAIAQAAAQHGVPLLALRAISDNPAEPLPVNPDSVMDENYRLQIGKMIRLLLRHPKIILQAGRMQRNSAIAAENAAVAVLGLLFTQVTQDALRLLP